MIWNLQVGKTSDKAELDTKTLQDYRYLEAKFNKNGVCGYNWIEDSNTLMIKLKSDELTGLILQKPVAFYNYKLSQKSLLEHNLSVNLAYNKLINLNINWSKTTDDLDNISSSDNENTPSHEVMSVIMGRVVEVNIKVGEIIKKNHCIAIIEAMKMENKVFSPQRGKVTYVGIASGDTVSVGRLICTIEPCE